MLEAQHKGSVDRFGNVANPGMTSMFRSEQIAHRSTWAGVGESEVATMAIHTVHCLPDNASTITIVGALDPGTTGEASWVDVPISRPSDVRHRRMT